MLTVLRKLRDVLTPSERRRALLVFVLMILLSLLEMVGVASVMPFLAVLGSPDMIQIERLFSGRSTSEGGSVPRKGS
jgi:ATP-binding cassette, subfamily B, bacterial PglK